MKPDPGPAGATIAGRTTILVHASPGEHRIALITGGVLTEFHIDRPAAPDGIGDVHLARVIAVVPAMAGAFLSLHDAEAFLPDSHGAAGRSAGDYLAVRVTRAAQGSKGPRVSAQGIDEPGETAGPVRLLQRGPTALQALQAINPGAATHHAPFDDGLEAEIDALGAPTADLEGGLRAHFAITPALTAIDLDGGRTTAAAARKTHAQRAANEAALPALVRQIVLRNLAGAILVDFAGIPTRARRTLGPALQAALAADKLGSTLAGFSHLGFAEIERPRLRPPLHEKLTSAHGAGLAALRRAASEAHASPARRLALRAAPTVITALRADPGALATLAAACTYPLVLRDDPALAANAWFIEDTDA